MYVHVYVANRNNAIPPVIQLMVALRFYATGSFLMSISDFCGISEASAQNIIHRVSAAIAMLKKEFIKLPTTPAEICRNQQEFFETAKFIRVVGCMDCTHMRIQSYGKNNVITVYKHSLFYKILQSFCCVLGGEDNELYRNRKGYFSINVQVIINARLEIIDIVARWPESTHDSTIFNNSRIKTLFEIGTFDDGLLLGDSGYPNLSYLITPLLNPTTPAEHLYNETQIRTRSKIEKCFGIWKRRFPVLSIGTRFHRVERTLAVIVATAILHNIAQQEVIPNSINSQIYNNVIQMQHVNASNTNINNRKDAILEYFNK